MSLASKRVRTICALGLSLALFASMGACAAPELASSPSETPTQTQPETPPATPEPTQPETATENEKALTGEPVEVLDGGESGYAMVEDADTAYETGLVAMGSEGMSYVDPYNTEEYAAVEESGFVATRTRPLSTVSADVDTASYCNLRRMINDGYRATTAADQPEPTEGGDDAYYDEWWYESNGVIPTGSVRIEEMLNYFDYDYAAPKGSDLFGVTARVGDCPWNADTKLLVLGFATAPEDATVAQKGSNLVFLVDVSGSMSDTDKLDLLKNAFGKLVDQLDEKDRVSIVTYASGEELVLEGASGADRTQIMRAINGLRADGSTNGEAGLKMAYDVAKANYIEGGVNRIVMASDGDLNVGITSESDLHDFVDSQRESGIYLSVLGFGAGNYKDNKMETLADHGNGSYHYIDGVAEAERVFGERLCANLVPFADDVKVQVEFNPAEVKGYRLIGYENRAMADEDFENDEKDAGDVGPGSQFTVAYEVALADSAMDIAAPELKYGQDEAASNASTGGEWLTAKLRYRAFADGEVHEQAMTVGADDLSKEPGDDWRLAAGIVEFGMLLRDSDYKGTASKDAILELLDVGTDESAERSELAGLVELALG